MARPTLRLSRHHNIKYEQLFPKNFRKNSGIYPPRFGSEKFTASTFTVW